MEVTTVLTEGENIEANVLSGVSPLKGSERHLSSKWDGKDDLFHKGLDGIEKIIEENPEDEEGVEGLEGVEAEAASEPADTAGKKEDG